MSEDRQHAFLKSVQEPTAALIGQENPGSLAVGAEV
jgi:hypothetical protein